IQSVGAIFNPKKCETKNLVSRDYIVNNKPIDSVSGASFFVNMEFLSTTGMIPEEYFLYYEELSWIKKMQTITNIGTIQTVLNSVIYHKGGGSTTIGSRPSLFSEYFVIRNKLLFTKINYPQFYILIYIKVILIIIKRILKMDFK